MSTRRSQLALLSVLVLAMLALAGCGSDDDSNGSSSGGGDAAKVTAEEKAAGTTLELGVEKGELKFDTTKLEAKAGTVTIRFDNTDSIPHNIALRDGDEQVLAESEIVSNDEVEITVTNLEPGEYEFYCTPHLAAGMTGTLTVT